VPLDPSSMYALNFYSSIVADQLRSRRKTATIRLGDKSGKYKKGMVVQILVGQRYGPREKIFDAFKISYPSAYAWSSPYSIPLCTIFT